LREGWKWKETYIEIDRDIHSDRHRHTQIDAEIDSHKHIPNRPRVTLAMSPYTILAAVVASFPELTHAMSCAKAVAK
jgi:hypothetical protein